ncbi:MAG: Acetyltransferase, family [Frankiales bacterium]|nr:Acetyltransferase, family [Frankiales bacterium]
MAATSQPRATASVVGLRPVEAVDTEFLVGVYASTREQELAPVAWDAAEKDAFIRMQFAAQDQYWRGQKPGAAFDVIVVDGQPAGRLYVDRLAGEIRIIDIALLPEHRGHGVGTALLRDVLQEGADAGLPVTIHVEQGNRARALYERLGFTQIGATGVYDLLERRQAVTDPSEREVSHR